MKEQYKGKLSIKAASKGIIYAVENSKSLLSDAILLFENERYERAISLTILAIEEAGKPSILRSIVLLEDEGRIKKEWQNYRKHTKKNTFWIAPQLMIKGVKHLDDLFTCVNPKANHPYLLDELKQLNFYTDVFSLCKWSTPQKIASKNLAKTIIDIAKILIQKDDTCWTEMHLEIWIKYMKPVWEKDMDQMKTALINCYQEMEDKELVAKGQTSEMKNFVWKT